MKKTEDSTLAKEREDQFFAEYIGTCSADETDLSANADENIAAYAEENVAADAEEDVAANADFAEDIPDREEYQRLIKTKYKDFYTEDTQKMINRRFKRYKAMEERLKALEAEAERAKESAERGASLSQEALYEEVARHKDELAAKFPDFSLAEAMSSDSFKSLARVALESGNISLAQAYRLAYFDSLVGREVERAQREAEERMAESIRARRTRPSENATSPRRERVAFDVASLTREERARLALRASMGEKIKF